MSFFANRIRDFPGRGWFAGVGRLSGLCVILVTLGWSFSLEAQTPNDEFEAFIFDICVVNPPPDASPELIDLCVALFPGGGTGTDPGVNTTSNTGLVGAQDQSNREGARRNREVIDSRLEDEGEDLSLLGAGGELQFGGLGAFVSLQRGETDRDQTILESGFESKLVGVIAGLDYAFSDRFIAGIAAGYFDDDTTFDAGAGTLESRGRSGIIFATFAPLDNVYVGGILS